MTFQKLQDGPGGKFDELKFKITPKEQLKKTFANVAKKFGVERERLRFVSPDGENLIDSVTAEDAELEDGDTVDVNMS